MGMKTEKVLKKSEIVRRFKKKSEGDEEEQGGQDIDENQEGREQAEEDFIDQGRDELQELPSSSPLATSYHGRREVVSNNSGGYEDAASPSSFSDEPSRRIAYLHRMTEESNLINASSPEGSVGSSYAGPPPGLFDPPPPPMPPPSSSALCQQFSSSSLSPSSSNMFQADFFTLQNAADNRSIVPIAPALVSPVVAGPAPAMAEEVDEGGDGGEMPLNLSVSPRLQVGLTNEVSADEIGQIMVISRKHDRAYSSVKFDPDLAKEVILCSLANAPLSPQSSFLCYCIMIHRVTKSAKAFLGFSGITSGMYVTTH